VISNLAQGEQGGRRGGQGELSDLASITAYTKRTYTSLYTFHSRRFPGSFTGRQNRRRCLLRPVEAHYEVNRAVRRGEPVRFFARELIAKVSGFTLTLD
jgi:hypothetical protein